MGAIQSDGFAGVAHLGGKPESYQIPSLLDNVVAFLYSP
jgi:hypothetical protein